jgi:hypothetical protein
MLSKSNKYLKQYSNHIIKHIYSQYKKRGVVVNQNALKTIQNELEEEAIKITRAAVNSLMVVTMATLLKEKEVIDFATFAVNPYDDKKIDNKSSVYLLKMIQADEAIPEDLVPIVHAMLCSQIIDTDQIDVFLEGVDNIIANKNTKKRILKLCLNNIFLSCVWGHKVKYKDMDIDPPSNVIVSPPTPSDAPVN